MLNTVSIDKGRAIIKAGGIVAYPTEAVYGLGCEAFNQTAVKAILSLKGRDIHKGMIVLIAEWSQLFSLISPITEAQLAHVRSTWPGFITWVFPCAADLPKWISGDNNSIAIRMSAHPIARALAMESPIISTSANQSGQQPALTAEAVYQQFPKGIDALLEGELGGYTQPSMIYDVRSGERLR